MVVVVAGQTYHVVIMEAGHLRFENAIKSLARKEVAEEVPEQAPKRRRAIN